MDELQLDDRPCKAVKVKAPNRVQRVDCPPKRPTIKQLAALHHKLEMRSRLLHRHLEYTRAQLEHLTRVLQDRLDENRVF